MLLNDLTEKLASLMQTCKLSKPVICITRLTIRHYTKSFIYRKRTTYKIGGARSRRLSEHENANGSENSSDKDSSRYGALPVCICKIHICKSQIYRSQNRNDHRSTRKENHSNSCFL